LVARREEILDQAMRTYRTIRPRAVLGKYAGSEKSSAAAVVFASIQTLGSARRLDRFRPDEFDYLVVDEFHHAAASTYRRPIDLFTPKFLLGLTATPERTDGASLRSLCGENLAYRCDLAEGIRRGLLAPFDYYGVPDEVDYENIPWRSNRFDEEQLTTAVATTGRECARVTRIVRSILACHVKAKKPAKFPVEIGVVQRVRICGQSIGTDTRDPDDFRRISAAEGCSQPVVADRQRTQ
jgi:superfamily II DNA or RNA helicase